METLGKILIKFLIFAACVTVIGTFLTFTLTLSSYTSDLFARPTNIAGALDWGPATVANSIMWRCMSVPGLAAAMNMQLMFGLIDAALVMLGGWLTFKLLLWLVNNS